MKPLTIEELNALEVGDYVWLVDTQNEWEDYYRKLDCLFEYELEELIRFESIDDMQTVYFNDYGTKWLAYKNKEQAEAKGEIVELPCKVGDKVYRLYKLSNVIEEWEVVKIVIAKKYFAFELGHKGTNDYSFMHSYELGKLFFLTKVEAEARLQELRGEK